MQQCIFFPQMSCQRPSISGEAQLPHSTCCAAMFFRNARFNRTARFSSPSFLRFPLNLQLLRIQIFRKGYSSGTSFQLQSHISKLIGEYSHAEEHRCTDKHSIYSSWANRIFLAPRSTLNSSIHDFCFIPQQINSESIREKDFKSTP